MTPDEYNAQVLEGQMEHTFEPDEMTHLTKVFQAKADLKVDGMYGPLTKQTVRNILDPDPEDAGCSWSAWDGPLDRQPATRQQVYRMFGNPGRGKPDMDWVAQHILECHPRYGNGLPAVPPERYIKVHRDIEPYLREGLRRVELSGYRFERFACWNFRHQRHDDRRPLSYHSWGIAIDCDPHKNRAIQFPSASVAPEPWSQRWMEYWPEGLPRTVVDALKSVGFAWGGNWRSFIDGQHFEFVGDARV